MKKGLIATVGLMAKLRQALLGLRIYPAHGFLGPDPVLALTDRPRGVASDYHHLIGMLQRKPQALLEGCDRGNFAGGRAFCEVVTGSRQETRKGRAAEPTRREQRR